MSETIIGVIIGASIALTGTAITAVIGLLTWTRSLKYQILRDERDRLEKKCERYLDYYLDCLKKDAIDAPLGAALVHEFPEAIRDEFSAALKDRAFGSDDTKTKQQAYFRMAFAMSKAIAEYEKDIRKTYELVDPRKALQIATDIIQSGFIKW
ncbi:MAG: hypothetical protein ACYSYV_06545 [Planctomycetota bacterium]|jgi:hypothetical protein